MIIYKTTNLIKNKIYIGYDTKNNPEYLGSGILINRAIKKYGRENFKKDVIDFAATNEELCLKEIFWINFYNSQDPEIGYNIASGGFGGDTFTYNVNKEEIRQKNSDGHKGKDPWNKGKKGIYSEETKRKMSESKIGKPSWSKGKTFSEAHCRHISETRIKKQIAKGGNNPRFGSRLSNELKSKISQKLKGRIPWNKGIRSHESQI